MPARNVTKIYAEENYYHIYNRGVSKQKIFLDDDDYEVFLGLLKRYLDEEKTKKSNRVNYPSYADEVQLLSYCLMPNHFHLLLYQESKDGMVKLLKSVSVSYSMYFNRKYKHVGAVFQQRYRAVKIDSDTQLMHISRYIHMNPKDYYHWPWSSLDYFLGRKTSGWMHHERLPLPTDYKGFLDEYRERREELNSLKNELAG